MTSQNVESDKIKALFEKLKSATSSSELDDTLALISSALEGQNGLQLLQNPELVPYLLSGLQAPSAPIRLVTLKELQRLSLLPTSVDYFNGHGFLSQAVTMLTDDDVGVQENALGILANLTQSPAGLAAVLSEESIKRLRQIASTDETLRFRVLDLYCRIASQGSAQFQACNHLQLLDTVLEQLHTDDILLRLNSIQLLENLGTTIDGIKYLQARNVLRQLWQTISAPKPEDVFILPTAIQVVSSLSRWGDVHFQAMVDSCTSGSHPINIAESLRLHLNHDNDEVVIATIWAVSSMAASHLGLKAVLDPSSGRLLSEWLEFSASSNGDVRAALLSAVGSVIDRRAADDPTDTPSLQLLYSKIFQHIPESITMERLMKQLDEPLIQLRFAAFAVLKALAKHAWGIKESISYPGFREFLTNRATEHTKRGGEWKYAIIQQILQHPSSKDIVGVNYWHELALYVKQGPFYFRHETKVMVEDRAE